MLAEHEPIVPENHVPPAVFAEAIRPPVLTKKMEIVETRYGQPIKAVLSSYYWDKKMSGRQMGEEFGVAGKTLVRWMKRLGIRLRSRSEATSTTITYWEPPKNKQARLDRILSRAHTAEVNAARAESLRKYYRNHPESVEKAREQQKKAMAMEARIRQAFGNNPAYTLRTWHWEERLTIDEIARRVGKSWRFVSRAMVNSGVERRGAYKKYLQNLVIKMRADLPASDWFDIFSFQRLRDKGVVNGDHQQRTVAILGGIIDLGRRLKGVTGQDGIGDISFGQFYEYLMLCLRFMETNPDKRRKLQAVAKG